MGKQCEVPADLLFTVDPVSQKYYYDQTAGQRLRMEIYEPGYSRDVNESIEKFLPQTFHRPVFEEDWD